jgi:putative ABC transport system permease protein
MRFKKFFRTGPRSTRELDAELREEIDSHLQMCADALERKGLKREAALAAARERFGDFEESMRTLKRSARQRSARVQRRELWHAIGRNCVVAWRQARRAPGFSIAVILTLALGIGANAAMFGIVDRLLIKPPSGVQHPEEVRRFYWRQTFSWSGLTTQEPSSYGDYAMLRDEGKSWSAVAAHYPGEAMFGRGEAARPIRRNLVTASYWSLLKPRLHLGRFFTEEEDTPSGAANVAVLGYQFWRSAFGADTNAIGKQFVMDKLTFTIVGVASRDFTGTDLERIDAWVPMSAVAPMEISDQWQGRGVTWLRILGRLRPGVTDLQAAAEATVLFRRGLLAMQRESGSGNATVDGVDPTAAALLSSLIEARSPVGSLRRTALIARWLAIMSFLVLIIATTNVTSLLLARASARQREVAVRTALGASYRSLAGLLLSESALYAVAGSLTGLLIAAGTGRLVQRLLLPNIDWGTSIPGRNVLVLSAFTLVAIAGLTSIAPILRVRSPNVGPSLKATGRGTTLGRSRARSVLILVQAALSVVLLCGAGLFVRSLHRAVSTDLGFDASRVLVTRLEFNGAVEEPERSAIAERLVTIARQNPDVVDAALGTSVPFYSSMSRPIRIPGRDSIPKTKDGGPYMVEVTPEFFRTVGTQIVRGRGFDENDRTGGAPVAVLNETMARQFFPAEDALGRCIQVGSRTAPCTTVVGIARDTHRESLSQVHPVFQYYLPLAQRTRQGFRPVIFVRTKGDKEPVIAALRRESAAISPSVSYVRTQVLQELIEPQIQPWRLGAGVFAGFGVLALLIAGVGLYSVLSYEVNRRQPEFGIRMALGAPRWEIGRLVLKHGTLLVVLGVLIGISGVVAGGHLVAPLLFETSPLDGAVIAIVPVLLVLTALIASFSPALRAGRIDPNSVLKED